VALQAVERVGLQSYFQARSGEGEQVHPPPGLPSASGTSERMAGCPEGGVGSGAEMSVDTAEMRRVRPREKKCKGRPGRPSGSGHVIPSVDAAFYAGMEHCVPHPMGGESGGV